MAAPEYNKTIPHSCRADKKGPGVAGADLPHFLVASKMDHRLAAADRNE